MALSNPPKRNTIQTCIFMLWSLQWSWSWGGGSIHKENLPLDKKNRCSLSILISFVSIELTWKKNRDLKVSHESPVETQNERPRTPESLSLLEDQNSIWFPSWKKKLRIWKRSKKKWKRSKKKWRKKMRNYSSVFLFWTNRKWKWKEISTAWKED